MEDLFSDPYNFDADATEYHDAKIDRREALCFSVDSMPWSISRDCKEASFFCVYEIPRVASVRLQIKASIDRDWKMSPFLSEVRLCVEEMAEVRLDLPSFDVTVHNMDLEEEWAHFKTHELDRAIQRAKDLDALQNATWSGSDTEHEESEEDN